MAGAIWAVTEVGPDGLPTRVGLETATAARLLAAEAGRDAAAVVVAADPRPPADILARYVPRVIAVALPDGPPAPDVAIAGAAVAAVAAVEEPGVLLVGATPDGRSMAGVLAARLDLGVLANATALSWGGSGDGAGPGPRVEMSVLGGRAITVSAFADGRGIISLRPSVVAAAPAASPGVVEAALPAVPVVPTARVVDRAPAAGRPASIEEARIVVAGGRGIGGPEGVRLVEELAVALRGAVGATRAAVDAGWLPYAVQVGQTGKTIRPAVYVAVGISGAIQHRVGMQDAETIVAINRDAEAPLVEHADLYVVGDLFEVVPALVSALRARSGGQA